MGYDMHVLLDEYRQMPYRRSIRQCFCTFWEILPAASSAFITTCYAVKHANAVSVG